MARRVVEITRADRDDERIGGAGFRVYVVGEQKGGRPSACFPCHPDIFAQKMVVKAFYSTLPDVSRYCSQIQCR
jgi:hypothetical protein